MVTDPQTQPKNDTQIGPITINCAAANVQCKCHIQIFKKTKHHSPFLTTIFIIYRFKKYHSSYQQCSPQRHLCPSEIHNQLLVLLPPFSLSLLSSLSAIKCLPVLQRSVIDSYLCTIYYYRWRNPRCSVQFSSLLLQSRFSTSFLSVSILLCPQLPVWVQHSHHRSLNHEALEFFSSLLLVYLSFCLQ